MAATLASRKPRARVVDCVAAPRRPCASAARTRSRPGDGTARWRRARPRLPSSPRDHDVGVAPSSRRGPVAGASSSPCSSSSSSFFFAVAVASASGASPARRRRRLRLALSLLSSFHRVCARVRAQARRGSIDRSRRYAHKRLLVVRGLSARSLLRRGHRRREQGTRGVRGDVRGRHGNLRRPPPSPSVSFAAARSLRAARFPKRSPGPPTGPASSTAGASSRDAAVAGSIPRRGGAVAENFVSSQRSFSSSDGASDAGSTAGASTMPPAGCRPAPRRAKGARRRRPRPDARARSDGSLDHIDDVRGWGLNRDVGVRATGAGIAFGRGRRGDDHGGGRTDAAPRQPGWCAAGESSHRDGPRDGGGRHREDGRGGD